MAGALLMAAGFAIFGATIWITQHEDRSLRWTQVDGVIISSEVNLQEDGEFYSPDIAYEYAVAGSTRVGTKVKAYLLMYNWSGPAKRLCERYRTGVAVKVYVDPNNPLNAVLEPGMDSHAFAAGLGAGVCLVFVGALTLAW